LKETYLIVLILSNMNSQLWSSLYILQTFIYSSVYTDQTDHRI